MFPITSETFCLLIVILGENEFILRHQQHPRISFTIGIRGSIFNEKIG